jgi:hypothetical protein
VLLSGTHTIRLFLSQSPVVMCNHQK